MSRLRRPRNPYQSPPPPQALIPHSEIPRRVALKPQALHDSPRSEIVGCGVAEHFGQSDALEYIVERRPCGLARVARAPGAALQPPPNLAIRRERMIVAGRHHAGVAEEFVATRFD